MQKHAMSRRIVSYEVVGFAAVIVLIWINELLDLPHNLFAAPATPVNLRECISETCAVALLGLFVVVLTVRLLRKIRVLEGFLPVCAACKKVRVDDRWIEIESYITEHSEARFSHSVCPACAEELYGEQLAAMRRREQ